MERPPFTRAIGYIWAEASQPDATEKEHERIEGWCRERDIELVRVAVEPSPPPLGELRPALMEVLHGPACVRRSMPITSS